MPFRIVRYIGIIIISILVLTVSFYATNILNCYLNPEFDRILWVKIDPPDD